MASVMQLGTFQPSTGLFAYELISFLITTFSLPRAGVHLQGGRQPVLQGEEVQTRGAELHGGPAEAAPKHRAHHSAANQPGGGQLPPGKFQVRPAER